MTLPKNLSGNPGPHSKFVLLDYGSPDDLVSYILANHSREIASGKLVLYRCPDQGQFRMAHAKNMAHRLGILEGGDILVNLDADNYAGERFEDYLAWQFRNPNIFMWTRVRPLDGSEKLPKGSCGRIAVSAHAFINSGGYDEKYETWAPDDKDFNARLLKMGYERKEISREFIDVVLHNDRMRFKDYPHLKNSIYSSEFEIDEDATIANFGNFGCGTVYRNFDTTPIELKPIPTRIFGIGMHKTATTSLHHALQILGYDSAHWKSAHWAKMIWREMNTLGRSPTLERHYALCDLPIPLFYKELDQAYPGSKFILTTREERGWLKTVERHWDANFNPFRKGWDSDPFSHKMHREIYGRKSFDADTMLARYRKHNADVHAYFKDRPGDLLVMDMDFGWPMRKDQGMGWHHLCEFLDKPVPNVPYPKSFAAY
jgi:hypothetical protein